ncbi:MAG: GNAT family N-acetyltransferase [Ignavibacteriales bacterium]|nr:MAG: GNAT family N-acetyltransferase [Ignavibacteriales bacterium]
MNIETILLKLAEDPIRNLSITGFVENNGVQEFHQAGNSILIKQKSDQLWVYISSKDENEFKSLVDMMSGEDEYYASLEDWMIPFITNCREIDWKLITMRYYLPREITLPVPVHKAGSLTPGDAEFIMENAKYKDYLSLDYIVERIMNGLSSCIRIDDKPAAWALTHDDGSLGFLQVMDNYQRKGLGISATISLAQKVIAKGKIPFANIEEDNLNAINLVNKIGFKKDRRITWFKLR